MNENIGLGFFQDSDNFLTDLSDLESEYIRGGDKKGKSKTKKTKTKKTHTPCVCPTV